MISVIIQTVSGYFGVNPFQRNRAAPYIKCRQFIWYLLRHCKEEYYSFPVIAKRFKMDTATIQHGVNVVTGYLSCDEAYKKDLDNLQKLLPEETLSIAA